MCRKIKTWSWFLYQFQVGLLLCTKQQIELCGLKNPNWIKYPCHEDNRITEKINLNCNEQLHLVGCRLLFCTETRLSCFFSFQLEYNISVLIMLNEQHLTELFFVIYTSPWETPVLTASHWQHSALQKKKKNLVFTHAFWKSLPQTVNSSVSDWFVSLFSFFFPNNIYC